FAPSVSMAMRARPELKQIDANVRSAQQSERLADAGLKPNLGVQANYNYTGVVSGFSSLHDNLTIALVGSWTPFDWGATRARRDEAREDEQTTRYQRSQTEQGIEYQVRQAVNAIANSLQRYAAAEAAVGQG